MNKPYRRFEMWLPLLFNDKQPVPESLIVETLVEPEQRFGSVSSETQTTRGRWHHEGEAFRDDLVRVFVDLPDEPAIRQFFADYKELLKARFQQLDIWMTTYPIEVM